LHSAHAGTVRRFSRKGGPSKLRGTTWSRVRPHADPQYAQSSISIWS
jgi:hypothetical protein